MNCGSVRQACNVADMAVMIMQLKEYGAGDYGTFVRKWNSQNARSYQILGRKANALKYLFECTPCETLLAILGHIGKFGYNGSAWSDENLSSKRFYQGHQFSAKAKKWSNRLVVTPEIGGVTSSRDLKDGSKWIARIESLFMVPVHWGENDTHSL